MRGRLSDGFLLFQNSGTSLFDTRLIVINNKEEARFKNQCLETLRARVRIRQCGIFMGCEGQEPKEGDVPGLLTNRWLTP